MWLISFGMASLTAADNSGGPPCGGGCEWPGHLMEKRAKRTQRARQNKGNWSWTALAKAEWASRAKRTQWSYKTKPIPRRAGDSTPPMKGPGERVNRTSRFSVVRLEPEIAGRDCRLPRV